ncbi:MAG: hypothetical protein C0417_05540 [Chlorobiaceae bacterium]|nr:hypothetical protein [Chlorobiaceae bacterium]
MKKIFLYSPYWSTYGGGEKYILAIGEMLSRECQYDVTLLSTDAVIQKNDLAKFSGIDISKLNFVKVNDLNEIQHVVDGADCFIFQSNVKKIVTQARHCVQIIQIPYSKITPVSLIRKSLRGDIKEAGKDILRLQLLKYARDKSSLVLTYSKFVQDVLLNNYKIHSNILHPPIQDFYETGYDKKNIILSVGRLFHGLYNNKRYDIMTEAFRKMSDAGLTGWEYHIIGTAATDGKSQEMIQNLKKVNQKYQVYFHLNESFDVMRRLYNESSIFWHGAGYGIDEKKNPENAEHFGMTTVEAMSAGCIPIVVNRGGQREIVTPGVNGFLWETIDELISHSFQIIHGNIDRGKYNSEVRKRFNDYSFPSFQKRALEILNPFL